MNYLDSPIINYHTHTWRCMHAKGKEEQYVQQAIREGFQVLGFADHTPWPYQSGFVSGMRMRLDQFEDYRETILGLREKYAGQIAIPLGLECEAFPEYFGWLKDFKAEYLDYIIMGNHYDYTDEGDHNAMNPGGGFYFGRSTRPEHIFRYAERTLAGMQTGLYNYVAHPDLFMHTYPAFDADCLAVSRDLCECAKALDLPMEYNLLGLYRRGVDRLNGGRGYPCEEFWQVAAQVGCKAIVGYDAHEPDAIGRRHLYDEAHAFLDGLGIQVIRGLDGIGIS